MDLIADILLIAGAMGAAFYCIVLSRRLNRFTDLEKGVGGAVAVMSAQVDEMTKTLERAQGSASGSTKMLETLTVRAEDVAKRLELLVASMHDIPEEKPQSDDKAAEPTDAGPVFKASPQNTEPAGSLFKSARAFGEEVAA